MYEWHHNKNFDADNAQRGSCLRGVKLKNGPDGRHVFAARIHELLGERGEKWREHPCSVLRYHQSLVTATYEYTN